MKISQNQILIVIFIIAVFLRLLFFPYDINFAYDQARDSFDILELVAGDLKFIGPASTFEGINHGVLFYYVSAPFLIFTKNPVYLSIFMRIINASGIFLTYKISSNLFNKRAGVLASLLYAISFEQTQFAIFLGPPPLAIITSLIFIWGESEVIFSKNRKGLIIAALGLGLSLQVHFSMLYLFPAALTLLIAFRKSFSKVDRKVWIYSSLITATAVLFYFSPGLKNGFSNIKRSAIFAESLAFSERFHLETVFNVASRFFKNNIFEFGTVPQVIVIIISAFIVCYKLSAKRQVIFLSIWFLWGLAAFLIEDPGLPRYVSAMGTSVALITISSFILSLLLNNKRVILIALSMVFVSNFYLIMTYNPSGTISAINAQPHMLLTDQKAALDYIYREADGQSFSVNAVTIPYNINTTWSYLFEWYGVDKYGYLPVWAGVAADGFNGNLEVIHARSKGPKLHFTIIEPERGISEGLVKKYLEEEDIFTKVVYKKKFGALWVQKRELY